MSKDWLNDLRRKMEDHTENVPEGLWDDIRSELFDEDEHILGAVPTDVKGQIKNNAPKLNTIVYRAVSVAAVLAFVFFGINHFFENSNEKKIVRSGDSKTESVIAQSSSEETNNSNTYNQDYIFKNDHISKIFKDKLVGNRSSETIKDLLKGDIAHVFNADEQKKSLDFNNQNQILSQENNTKSNSDEFRENEHLLAINELDKKPDLPKIKTNKSWMVSVLTGNASSGSAGQVPGYATFNGSNMSISDVFHSSSTELDPLTQVLLANQDQQVDAKIKHKMPVTFGVSVYYNIGKRWGIGTGITYTKLSSDLHSGSDANYIQSDQTIHYVGVPVQVNYNVIKKPAFTGYLTAGTLIEKSVSGSLKTKYVVENAFKDETEEKLSSKPTQISVNAAAGVQLNVTNRLGIYAEPGLGYHFKDNSTLNTIYKEKPLNFNLKFGLRLALD
ncbi:PorT family protein [Chryseobacterium sp. C-71]|uniref:outer membrane beta-barrel protein n=1 Tax=Chryseobacterium sp. C-71 TaxID=2893882 RepID=UPI001E3982B9|nr:outer membrane beta-barrel protein [Chryseobacterium sp. C-71]UFH30651.1 PorT family protein [Chryseobacterium sp. C-71]